MSGFSDNSISTPTHNEFLTGVVERLTFHSKESGYTVARLRAYKLAREYVEHYAPQYGTGITLESTPILLEIAEFWCQH